MADQVIVWDIETVPDLDAFAAAADLEGKPEAEIREAMGPEFRSQSSTKSSASAP